MCRLVVEACKAGDQQALKDVRMVCAENDYTPASPQEFCNRIFHTCFMGSTNSSEETRSRARELSKAIGGMIRKGDRDDLLIKAAYHTNLNIDSVVIAMISLFTAVTR